MEFRQSSDVGNREIVEWPLFGRFSSTATGQVSATPLVFNLSNVTAWLLVQ
jgi:hypothetical protein